MSGISREHLGELVAELAPKWEAQQESALVQRGGGDRRRAEGAGPKHQLSFLDRLLVTLMKLRHDLPDAALAELLGVDRSTISGAVRQIRPLLAARGFAVPDRPGIGLRTLEDVFAYAAAEGVKLRIDGTDVQVRRPAAGWPGRKADYRTRPLAQGETRRLITPDPPGTLAVAAVGVLDAPADSEAANGRYVAAQSGARGSVWRQLWNHTEPRLSDQEPSISFRTSGGTSEPEETAKNVAVFGVSPMAMATLGEMPSTS
ncbi:helix-turn-helix domain-containing protein [Streptomyces laculatispora]|uniref:helix-turn-helix domain-containing protein n=1 Tax=Streptomyces laculatispora TaxID=887464 RepID=UPI001A93ED8C|nr:transposase family protein [Streptomyces laculatispora]MBO0915674.1 transposase family protein [Streptomyces laculatispora]